MPNRLKNEDENTNENETPEHEKYDGRDTRNVYHLRSMATIYIIDTLRTASTSQRERDCEQHLITVLRECNNFAGCSEL